MDLKTLLFSFEGRIGRQQYIVASVCASLAAGVSAFVLTLLGVLLFGRHLGALLGYLPMLIGWWIGIALAVKRVHDRDRTAWFILICLIPLVGIWFIVEAYFLKGTYGQNRFGADPLV